MNISGLAAEINRQMELFAQHTEESMRNVAEKVALEGAKKLRETSPKRTGAYANGWGTIKKGNLYIVRNEKHYRLTHLIERSHALRNGGRSTPQPHIKPVEVEMIKDFEQGLRREIGQ